MCEKNFLESFQHQKQHFFFKSTIFSIMTLLKLFIRNLSTRGRAFEITERIKVRVIVNKVIIYGYC